jgi:CBS-domain-containing membrane protein
MTADASSKLRAEHLSLIAVTQLLSGVTYDDDALCHVVLQGVPLLLGSFGTLAILLFGKPEAEPVRVWPIIAGQVGAAAIVMTVLQVWGANLVSRAAAMAATVAWMMWSDCIHPPGGRHLDHLELLLLSMAFAGAE